MALTKISRGLLDTGVSDSSDATAITIDSSENVLVGKTSSTITSQTNSMQVSKAVTTHGAIASHTTSAGVFEFNNNKVSIRAYGDVANSGFIALSTGGGGGSADSERMRIDTSGNVGVGTSSPNAYSNVTTLTINGTNQGRVDCEYGGTLGLSLLAVSGESQIKASGSSNVMTFEVNNSERMRIDTSGRVLINTTTGAVGSIGTANRLAVVGGTNATVPMVVFVDQDSSVEAGCCLLELGYEGDAAFSEAFYVLFSDSNGTQGSISGTGNQTVSFNTSSDRRLKENIVNTESQLEKIKQIEVKDFNYIGNDKTTTGMIAQELNAIIPNVVIEGGEDFKKHPWSIDYGKLTPYLIKAIQEQQEEIEQLKQNSHAPKTIEEMEGYEDLINRIKELENK